MTKRRPQRAPVADHHSFLRSLDPATRSTLTAQHDLPGLLHLAGHAGLIFSLVTLIAIGVPGWPILMLPLGILVVFLFTLLHEVSHDTVFRAKWANRAVAWVAGFILILGPAWFRYFHLAHHRHTHDPDRDPELATPKPVNMRQYIWHISGIPLWGAVLRALWTNMRGKGEDAYVPDRQRGWITTEARILATGYAVLLLGSLATGSAMLLWVWIIPMLLGQPFLRLYLMAEHTLCPHSADMFENTRTTFTTRAIRLLAWNMPYHAEHHAFPTVPFHQLPALHELTRAHLRQTADGYADFHADYRARL